MTGWGSYIAPVVEAPVRNLAYGGATTASFLADGSWARLLDGVEPGDTVVIQFGHNDQKLPELGARGGYTARPARHGRRCPRPGCDRRAVHVRRAALVRRRPGDSDARRLPQRRPRPRARPRRPAHRPDGVHHVALRGPRGRGIRCSALALRAGRASAVDRRARRRHALPRGGRAPHRGLRGAVAARHRAPGRRCGRRRARSSSAESRGSARRRSTPGSRRVPART